MSAATRRKILLPLALVIIATLLLAPFAATNASAQVSPGGDNGIGERDSDELTGKTDGKDNTDQPKDDGNSFNDDDVADKKAQEEEEASGCDLGIADVVLGGGFSELMDNILLCGWKTIWNDIISNLNEILGKLLAETAFSLPDIGADSAIAEKYNGLVDKVKGALILGVLFLGALMMLKSANYNTQYAVLDGLPKLVFVALALAYFPEFMTMVSDLATGLSLSFMEENKLGSILMKFMSFSGMPSAAESIGGIVLLILGVIVFAVSLIKNIIFSLLYMMGPLALICYPLPGLSAITYTWFRAVMACFVISLLFCVEMLVGSWIIDTPSLLFGKSWTNIDIVSTIMACILLWIMWKTPFKVLEWACQGHYSPGRGAMGMISDTLKNTAKSASSGLAKGAAGAMVGGAIGGALASAGSSSRKGVAHAAGNATGKKIGEKLLGVGGPGKAATGQSKATQTASAPASSGGSKSGIRDSEPGRRMDPKDLIAEQQDNPTANDAPGNNAPGAAIAGASGLGAAAGSEATSAADSELASADQQDRSANNASPVPETIPTAANASDGTQPANGSNAGSEPLAGVSTANGSSAARDASSADYQPGTASLDPSEAAGAAAALGASSRSMESVRQAYNAHSSGPAAQMSTSAASQAHSDTLASATKDAHNIAAGHDKKAAHMKATANKTTDRGMRGKLRSAAVKESQKAASVRAGASDYAAGKAAEAYEQASSSAHSQAMSSFAKGAAGAMAATAAAGAIKSAKTQAASDQAGFQAQAADLRSQASNASNPQAAKSFASQALSAEKQAQEVARRASEPGYGGKEAASAHKAEYRASYGGLTGSQPKRTPSYGGSGTKSSGGGPGASEAAPRNRNTKPSGKQSTPSQAPAGNARPMNPRRNTRPEKDR